MIKPLQEKVRSNPKYLEYLHTHSYWYKKLNRSMDYFKEFEREVKKEYKLYPSDKIERTISLINTLGTILSTING